MCGKQDKMHVGHEETCATKNKLVFHYSSLEILLWDEGTIIKYTVTDVSWSHLHTFSKSVPENYNGVMFIKNNGCKKEIEQCLF